MTRYRISIDGTSPAFSWTDDLEQARRDTVQCAQVLGSGYLVDTETGHCLGHGHWRGFVAADLDDEPFAFL
jgi:hypothetical protein